MKTRSLLVLAGALVAGVTPAWSATAAKSTSDVVSPAKRQQAVDIATQLSRRPVPEPVPPNLKQPFNPASFDQPDAEEQKANAAAGIVPTTSAGTPAPRILGDRELLETLAARIPSTGTMVAPGNRTLLVVGKHRLEVGQTFTVTNPANGQDCDLELIAIDRTTFTLRYRGEELTRPILIKR